MPHDFFTAISNTTTPPEYSFYNGEQWGTSTSNQILEIISPVDHSILGTVQSVTTAEIDQCLMRLSVSQKAWQRVPLVKRGHILHLAADWIRHHEPFLIDLLVKEIGKPYLEAQDEVNRSADMIDSFVAQSICLTGTEISGDTTPGYDMTKTAIVEHVPHGVVCAISPFNYPLNLAISKIVPALLMGNAVIFKPALAGSITALHLTQILLMAGLPKGLIGTVTGSSSKIGDYLVTHPKIHLIAFTGSSEVGKSIAAKAGMVPLLMECGGNSPALILPDADMNHTAQEIVTGVFSYSGQRCTAIKYVFGLAPTLEQLLEKVLEKTELHIKKGDPHNKNYNFGPLISEEAATEVENRILKAKAAGAKIKYGGNKNGNFVEPTILVDVRPSMEIVHTETFGPVVSFIKVSSIDEAIKLINDSNYGLQVSIFTRDEGTGIALARSLNTGTVQINNKPQRGPDNFPFMGVKDSGVGVQGIHYTLKAMTRLKSIVLNSPQ
jgi:glyceraldehyde-3-phosphate dehydrogenase (NADP+)